MNRSDNGDILYSKLKPFSQNNEYLETYFNRFESFEIHYKWDAVHRLFYMKNSLGKDVGTVLWKSGTQYTVMRLMTLLCNRFCTKSQAERLKLKLNTRRREKKLNLFMIC